MTVARDAVLEFATFTTLNPATLLFTPTGTPRAVLVGISQTGAQTDQITGVTYGGVAMARIGDAIRVSGEVGRSYLYFLGTGIPTGAQTVSIATTAASTSKWAIVQSMTAATDTEPGAVGYLGGSYANPQILLDSGSRSALRSGIFFSGWESAASLTPLTGMEAITAANSHQWPNQLMFLGQETSASTGPFLWGYTSAAEDVAAAAAAVEEVQSNGFPQTAAPTVTVFNTATTAHLVVMPPVVAAGNLLIAVTASVDVTLSTPAGWTLLHSTPNGGYQVDTHYRIADGSEDGTTVDFVTGVTTKLAALVYRVRDWHGTTPPEVGTAATGTSVNPDPPSLTPSWGAANTLFMALGFVADGNDIFVTDYPTGYGNGTFGYSTAAGSSGVGVAWRELNAASDDPGTFTISGSKPWVGQTLAIRPAVLPVPAAPTALTATTVSDTEIDLAWTDNASDETGYRVERSLTGVGAWSDISGALAADAVSYSDTGLTAVTEYFYRVFAFNASGDSLPSNVDSATTQAAPIPPPSSGNRMGGTGAVRKPPR